MRGRVRKHVGMGTRKRTRRDKDVLTKSINFTQGNNIVRRAKITKEIPSSMQFTWGLRSLTKVPTTPSDE